VTESNRVGVVTQARTTSTRLPGKVLLEVGGVTMLDHHLNRLAAVDLDVYVATTTNQSDDPIVALAEGRGLPVWRGSEDDVLGRFAGCIRRYELDTVVRVTSDCPLIDAALIAEAVADFQRANDPWLYVSNGIRRTYPRGMDFEVFSAEALLEADARATLPAHREHVTPWLYLNESGRTTVRDQVRSTDASRYRVTLDTPEDLRLIQTLIEEYAAHTLGVEEIIAVLERHPVLADINRHIEQKELGQ
jgi:spore coat polysaccharide biosynthesis protein SpsF